MIPSQKIITVKQRMSSKKQCLIFQTLKEHIHILFNNLNNPGTT